jgi:hypothetical protein
VNIEKAKELFSQIEQRIVTFKDLEAAINNGLSKDKIINRMMKK